MTEPITSLSEAVADRGALPMPTGSTLAVEELQAENVRLRRKVDSLKAELKRSDAEYEVACGERDRALELVAELEALKPAPIQTCQKCGAGYTYGQPCSACEFKARMAAETARIVAYRDPHSPRTLLCREHGERWQGVYPVTAEDLPDGGTCTFGRLSSLECGRDVLIDPRGEAAS
jgi:hypothetical protein